MVVLVLTLSGSVHRVISVRRALDLMRRGKAVTVVESLAPPLRWARGAVTRPSVIYLTRPVPQPVRASRPTKRAILERDRRVCAYCGRPGATVDHVHPQHLCRAEARDANTWENLVCACEECQRRKGGLPLKESGLMFRSGFKPHAPRHILHGRINNPPPEWVEYLKQTAPA